MMGKSVIGYLKIFRANTDSEKRGSTLIRACEHSNIKKGTILQNRSFLTYYHNLG